MIEKTFALGTWEIHLQTDSEQKIISDEMTPICEYVDTAVNYNNDYILNSILKKHLCYKVISKIAPCHYPYYDLFVDNHIKCLGRDKIDIMLIHSSRGNWQDLAVRMNKDTRFKETGVSNFNVEEIEQYKNLVGHYPQYNELEINPYYTDVKTIEYCKSHGIKVISYGVFGGKYRSATYIAKYSVPYLLEYAAKFADIIILKPECERHVNELIDVIQNYIDVGENKIEMNNILDDKAVVPMTYNAPIIIKQAYCIPTYHNAAGINISYKLMQQKILDDKPNFEMLGDYMTYMRYLYRKNYNIKSSKEVYRYDILVGDNKKLYAVFLYDKNGHLSKINQTGNIKLVEITEEPN